jgi:HK97 family phage prohead protease
MISPQEGSAMSQHLTTTRPNLPAELRKLQEEEKRATTAAEREQLQRSILALENFLSRHPERATAAPESVEVRSSLTEHATRKGRTPLDVMLGDFRALVGIATKVEHRSVAYDSALRQLDIVRRVMERHDLGTPTIRSDGRVVVEHRHAAVLPRPASRVQVAATRRDYPHVGLPKDYENDPRTLVGYAAVWFDPSDPQGTSYSLFDDVVEHVQRGAFAACLRAGDDVVCLVEHDPARIVGRTSANNLKLSEDTVGLRFTVTPPPDSATARQLVCDVAAKNLQQCSFSFRATGVQWDEQEDGSAVRTITSCDVLDVSPVCWPAYSSTSIRLASKDDDALTPRTRQALDLVARRLAIAQRR